MLSSNSVAASIPNKAVVISAGAFSSTFTVFTRAVTTNQSVTITATYGTISMTASLYVTSLNFGANDLSCSPRLVQGGDTVSCEVHLSSTASPEALRLDVSTSDPSVRAPSQISTRPLQSTLSFQVAVDALPETRAARIQVSLGASTVQDFITVQGAMKPAASPARPPDQSTDNGGVPSIEKILHAATGSGEAVCAGGSLASIFGQRLSETSAADTSGASLTLAGAQVAVNGEYVPVVYASPSQVNFICPAGPVGSALAVSVETASGRSQPIQIRSLESAPGIFTVDGSGKGQAAATILDGLMLAMPRNYRFPGEPAQPGDSLWIPVTGLGDGSDAASISVKIGNLRVPVNEIRAIPGSAGVAQVAITVPSAVSLDDAALLAIERVMPDSRVTASQPVSIATEPARR
jgi:uncharacterized protein (TIGR03437 family)